MSEEILDVAESVGTELGEIGKNLLETGASLIGPAAIAGIVYIGFDIMTKPFQE